jgi:hypothetical protein
VDGCDVLAYSCAAARELHPLPCLRLRGEDAQTEGHFKEQKIIVEREIYRAGWWEVKWGYYLPAAKALGRKGGSVTVQRGSDYFRKLAARRKTHGGSRPRKDSE